MYRDPRLLAVLVLGVASSLPAPLLAVNLSIWLADSGLLAHRGGGVRDGRGAHAVNFLWAPVLMRPGAAAARYARLGQRRGWLAILLAAEAAAVFALGRRDPSAGLAEMAAAAVILAFVSASLDVVVDYHPEILDPPHMGAGSAAAILGWHLGGTVLGGAGGLLLAAHDELAGSLCGARGAAAGAARRGVRDARAGGAAARRRRPGAPGSSTRWRRRSGCSRRGRCGPVFAFIVLFQARRCDVAGARMSGVFYRELGFDYATIAEVGKIYGVGATLAGGGVGRRPGAPSPVCRRGCSRPAWR